MNIDQNALERAAIAAFKETVHLLGNEFTKTISDPGAFPDFPGQDIVDTGRLRASQQVDFSSDGTSATFSWPVDYALPIHEGYVKKGGRAIQGRPWTTVTLKRFNIQQTYNQILPQKLT